MPRYVDAEKIEKTLWDSLRGYRHVKEKCAVKNCILEIEEAPTADVVEVKAIEQLKWERDTAIKQLQLYGVGLGEDKELAEVKHGKWRLETDDEIPDPMFKLVVCSTCNKTANNTYNYCPNCGTKMDSKKE